MSQIIHRLSAWFSIRNRRRKARWVTDFVARHDISSVLFVGVGQGWEPRWFIVEEAAAQGADRVLSCDLATVSQVPWPYVRASGLALPFRDQAFDLVLSNAVIEHVGDEAAQQQFVAEHVRVGRHFVMTTPNRAFPVETHTLAVFRHWSPSWRARQSEFTRLLTRREFVDLLPPGAEVSGSRLGPTFIAGYSASRQVKPLAAGHSAA